MRVSAYLSVFDDWELLGPSIASIYDRVEEIVVVDGAYRWMAPMCVAAGRDPGVSCDALYAVLAPFAPKLRIITGVWVSEAEKRTAGFAACRERHVLRIDADEIMFFDDAEIDRFLASPMAAATIEIPLMLAPGLIRGKEGKPIERAPCLFDSERIGAAEHCGHLWLMMSQVERAALPKSRPGIIHPVPIGFAAHLTQWRPPGTAVGRARFYVLNYLRERRGEAWPPVPDGERDMDDVAWCRSLSERVDPALLAELLLGRDISVGFSDLRNYVVRPSPLRPDQVAGFAGLFDIQLEALAALNVALASSPRMMLTGSNNFIDLSSPAARAALGGATEVVFVFGDAVTDCLATLRTLSAAPPFELSQAVPFRIEGARVRLDLPAIPPRESFRCVLSLSVGIVSRHPHVSVMAER